MSWSVVLLLGAGSYALKAAGLVGFARLDPPAWVRELNRLLPAALMAALVVVQTFGAGESLTIDARAAGLAAAGVAVALRAPVLVVVALAAVVTALVRAVS